MKSGLLRIAVLVLLFGTIASAQTTHFAPKASRFPYRNV